MPYRPTDRTRARLAVVRERVAQAALEQLAAGGYASASVAVVARRAGVATGSVYRHFPSKADLFAEVFRRAGERELAVLRGIAARAQPVPDRVAAGVEAVVRRALAAPVLALALAAEPVDPAVDAERLAFRRACADLVARALREGMAAGELPRLDAELTAIGIVGALAEALVGPLERREAGAGALVTGLQAFVLRAIGAVEARQILA